MVNVHKHDYPYICVPITGRTDELIFEQLHTIIQANPDVIEWRADFYENLAHFERVNEIINQIKSKTNIPLLFTIRSAREGGEAIALDEEAVVQLLCDVCNDTKVDWVDYEFENKMTHVNKLMQAVKENNKISILSYHNFTETPSNEKFLHLAQKASQFQPDMVKIAVMPENEEDVFRLLEVTRLIDKQNEPAVITMSMGERGKISRMNGWLYGSILTFAVGMEASAPGQIAIEPLREVITNMKNILYKEERVDWNG